MAQRVAPLRHPAAPFPLTFAFRVETYQRTGEGIYPRAGVRLQPDGLWLLQMWFGPDVVRVDPEPLTHISRQAAVKAAQIDTHAARSQQHPAGQIHLRGIGKAHTP